MTPSNAPEILVTRLKLGNEANDDTVAAIHAAVLAHGRSKEIARTRLYIDVETAASTVSIDCNLRAFSPSPALLQALREIPCLLSIETNSYV